MGKFRKKPVEIEAIKWTGDNHEEITNFMTKQNYMLGAGSLSIITLEGPMYANIGDWIIRGINGENYPCKPDIFEKTYEAVED